MSTDAWVLPIEPNGAEARKVRDQGSRLRGDEKSLPVGTLEVAANQQMQLNMLAWGALPPDSFSPQRALCHRFEPDRDFREKPIHLRAQRNRDHRSRLQQSHSNIATLYCPHSCT